LIFFAWLGSNGTPAPLFGAASAYLSRRSGGDRSAAGTAALFPSLVMIPLWMVLATRMSHPSTGQWFDLFSGVLNWIVVPGAALLLGALAFLKAQLAMDWKRCLNTRTTTFWLPAHDQPDIGYGLFGDLDARGSATSFCGAGLSNFGGLRPLATDVAALRRGRSIFISPRRWRASACLAAGLFPVIAMTSLVGVLTLTGKFVYAKPQSLYFWMAVLLGAILPGVALLLGALPFAKASRRQEF